MKQPIVLRYGPGNSVTMDGAPLAGVRYGPFGGVEGDVLSRDCRLDINPEDAAEAMVVSAQSIMDCVASVNVDVRVGEAVPVHLPLTSKIRLSVHGSTVSALLTIRPIAVDWSLPFSIGALRAQFAAAIEDQRATFREPEVRWFSGMTAGPYPGDDELSVTVWWTRTSMPLSVGLVVSLVVAEADKILLGALARLKAAGVADRVVSYFRFPVEVAIACEQYLIYFVQFLRDLGIDADGDLKHEAGGEVLFTVKPKGKEDALRTIRDALDVYLNLPGSPDVEEMKRSNEIAVMSLNAEISGLKMRLELARAAMQYKEGAIQQRDLTIRVLQQLQPFAISGSSVPKPDEPESVLGGAMSVGAIELLPGVQVNAGEIIRQLRRR